MNPLLTEIQIPKAPFEVQTGDKFLLIGSCFTEEIGNRLKACKLQVQTNPFGEMYNWASIRQCLDILSGKPFPEEAIVHDGSLWHSYLHHGAFSRASKELLVESIIQSIESGVASLQMASVVIFTLGSAKEVKLKIKNEKLKIKSPSAQDFFVANLHKQPKSQFDIRLPEAGNMQIIKYLQECEALRGKRVILTISPVRHLGEGGLVENSLSKALLRTEMTQNNNTTKQQNNISYFPAYEIMLDELRDYRWYADDMLHPANRAVDYIWERFQQTYCSAETRQQWKELHQLTLDEQHRLLHPESIESQRFLQYLQEKKELLRDKYPYLEFEVVKSSKKE